MVVISSAAQIANMAFGLLHAEARIESLEDETSAEARKARLWYDVARVKTLEDFDWHFARKRQALAVHGVDAPAEWAFRYQLPADCIQPRYIPHPSGVTEDLPPFEEFDAGDGTMSVVTDVEDAVLVYTSDVTNTALFSPGFAVAMAYIYAHFLAGVISGKQQHAKEMAAGYESFLRQGAANSGNRSIARAPREASWVRFRNG